MLTVLAAAALEGAGCLEPLQNGGVMIIGDPGERLGTICRFRHGSAASESFCAMDGPSEVGARVRKIAGPGDALGGPYASGTSGDYVLENDEITIVIDQLGGGQGLAESGGNIVDAGDAKVRVDALGQMFTSFGMSMQQALYESVRTGVEVDGSAWVEVSGHELHDEKLRVRTRYTLAVGTRALAVATTLENTGTAELAGLDLGDTILWGGAANGAAGKETGFRGDATAPYLFGIGDGVAYAVATNGQPFFSKNGASWSNPAFTRGATIAPGAATTYERLFVVAPRGDTAAVATELFFLGGGAPGGLEVALAWEGKAFLRPNENHIALRRLPRAGAAADADDAPFPDPPSLWLAQPVTGSLAAELAPGRYAARLEGSAGTSDEAIVDVAAGKTTKLTLRATSGGLLRARVFEVEPAALETARAEWATSGNRSAGVLQGRPSPAKIQVLDAASGAAIGAPALVTAGSADIALPAGRYRIVASRGPELTIDETIVEIGKGRDVELELGLVRVVDTRGYIGCDLHQHSARSFDTAITLEQQLVASVAEGVECAVTAERNTVVDPQPLVDKLGLGAHLRGFPGNEIAGDAGLDPFGHLDVFPLAPDPKDLRGGAVRARDRSPRELLDELRALPGERVVQVNHPRSGARGYFNRLRFNPTTGTGDDAAYDARFDTVEVWSGRRLADRDAVLEDLWALLRTSHPVTPTASAYAHEQAGAEPGYPRTFVAVGDDDPAKLDAAGLTSGLKKRRDVVLTNGPFVTTRVGEVRQGGLASLGGKGRAELTVHIERAPWVDATELTLFVGGVATVTVPLTGSKKTERGALLDEVTFTLLPGKAAPAPGAATGPPRPITLPGDTFVVAMVRGSGSLARVLTGDPGEIRPFALTAPLWIDADGDGRSLGR